MFYNPLLVCPACVNQEVQEASSAGLRGGFSQPGLLGGACEACAGTLEVWDKPAVADGSQGQTLTSLKDAGAPVLAHSTVSSLCHHN